MDCYLFRNHSGEATITATTTTITTGVPQLRLKPKDREPLVDFVMSVSLLY